MNAAMDYAQVAHLYDTYVRTLVDVPFFLNEAAGSRRVLELMAGTGRVSIPLLEAGIRLTCVDMFDEMLAVLRTKAAKRGLDAEIVQTDICELILPHSYDLIFLPFNSFSEITDPVNQRNALARTRQHLDNEGRFICTLHNPPIRLKSVTGQRRSLGEYLIQEEEQILHLSSKEKYETATDLVLGTQYYEIRNKGGELESTTSIPVRFSLLEKGIFEEMIRSAGFTVLHLYGDYQYSPFDEAKSPCMVWVLGKR